MQVKPIPFLFLFFLSPGRSVFRADHRCTMQPPPTSSSAIGGPGSGGGGGASSAALCEQMLAMNVSGSVATVSSGGAAAGGGTMGRGATRGGRDGAPVNFRTRPEKLISKKGNVGQAVRLITNYFK